MVYEKLKDILVEKEAVDKNMIKYHVDTNDIDGAGTDFFLFGESLWTFKTIKKLVKKNIIIVMGIRLIASSSIL